MWATLKTTWFERFYDFYPLYLASSGGTTLVNNGKVVFENEAAVAGARCCCGADSPRECCRAPTSRWARPVRRRNGRDEDHRPVVREGAGRAQGRGSPLRRDARSRRPTGRDPANRFAFADLRSIAIFSTTRHPDAAARFVAFLTSPEADRLLIEEASQLPYRRGLATDPRFTASLAKWPTLSTYATYVERTRDVDLDPDVVEIFDILSEAYEEAADLRHDSGASRR